MKILRHGFIYAVETPVMIEPAQSHTVAREVSEYLKSATWQHEVLFDRSSESLGIFGGRIAKRYGSVLQILHICGAVNSIAQNAVFRSWVVHKRLRVPYILYLQQRHVESLNSMGWFYRRIQKMLLGDAAGIVISAASLRGEKAVSYLREIGISNPPPVAVVPSGGYIEGGGGGDGGDHPSGFSPHSAPEIAKKVAMFVIHCVAAA